MEERGGRVWFVESVGKVLMTVVFLRASDSRLDLPFLPRA